MCLVYTLSRNEIRTGEAAMRHTRSSIVETIQKQCERRDWHGAIEEMEKLFAINGDPHIRIRIGDAHRKLDRHRDAIEEYLFAADLFVREGFMAKALAQCTLVLRLEPSNEYARQMRELARTCIEERKSKNQSMEYRPQQQARMHDTVGSMGAFRLEWLAAVAALEYAHEA